MAEKGFINYFGLQRFGSKNCGTHYIGKAIVLQDYQLAFRQILLQDSGNPDVEEAKKEYLKTLDHVAMLKALPFRDVRTGSCSI